MHTRTLTITVLMMFSLAASASAQISTQERNALIDLYSNTNGANWQSKTGWLGAPGTECGWYGVTCNTAQTAVVELDLIENRLSGSIPSSLGNMLELTRLNLRFNELGGNIPSSLGNLADLQYLELGNNQLVGTVPSFLVNLTNLKTLHLQGNHLIGSIPSWLGDLTNLQDLALNSNQLTGGIPSELVNLTNLVQLYLCDQQLSGNIPAFLGNLANLEILNLRNSGLSGSIPSSLGNLAKLFFLDLSRNELSGSIPSSLGNLAKLQLLYLHSNRLGGNIPIQVTNLVLLSSLNIDYNAFYSTAPDVVNFLNSKKPGWQNTQTVTPSGVSATAQSSSSILVSWIPIIFTAGSGRYEIYWSTTSGGPYALAGSTASKSESSLLLTGLNSATTNYMTIRTVTDPNPGNDNTVTSEYSPEFAIGCALTLNAGGAAKCETAGARETTGVGYAKLTTNSGTTPYGTAVFSFRQNEVTVTEAGVPASPPTLHARIFVEYRTAVDAVPGRSDSGKIDVNTGIAVVNYGSGIANVTYTLRDLDGVILTSGNGTIAAGNHLARFIDQFTELASDFTLPPDFQFGSLDIAADQPLSVLALRMTANQRDEVLYTTTPVADLTGNRRGDPPPGFPFHSDVYFPQFADGGGYTTSLILLNASSSLTESGTLQILDNDGLPLVVRQVGGPSDSSFRYSIRPGGAFRFQTDGSPADTKVGWVQLLPDLISPAPIGSGVFAYNPYNILVSESGIPSAESTTHARVYVDLSRNHNTGLAITNLNGAAASITINAYQIDGVTPAGTSLGPLSLQRLGHAAKFADEFVADLPEGFTGVLDISSTTVFTALALRSLHNERNDFLMTTFPVADTIQAAPSPVVFPQVADGGGYTTEFILISASEAAGTTLSFFDKNGTPGGFEILGR